jgi:uncharacterized protein with ParB-like and HNH nuclease domain
LIQSANNYKLAALFSPEEKINYKIPAYQREYIWGKEEWNHFYDDLYEDSDHFLGSMICINKGKDAYGIQPLEVIDGQQRLLTVSILYLVIYERLIREKQKNGRPDEDLDTAVANLKYMLTQKSDKGKTPKITPSEQNNNYSDYISLLTENGIFQSMTGKSANAGNRRIYKAYRYLQNKLNEESKEKIITFLDNIHSASIVKIEVATDADAFMLFESLNNRGVPLSPMDIIKNKLLAELTRETPTTTNEAFDRWNSIVVSIPEYRDQERFLRQYYNAFRYKGETYVQGVSKATKSKLITIYEHLVERDPEKLLRELQEKSKLYCDFSVSCDSVKGDTLKTHLFDLRNIGGTPGYTLLLYLSSEHKKNMGLVKEIAELLVKYFVRRNITDYPGTRDLDKIFIDAIDFCESNRSLLSAESVKEYLTDKRRFASDDRFREMLSGDIYDNPDATRFVLTKIEESHSTKEKKPNFWERNDNNDLVWTIEHIFPKGDNIPEDWIRTIAQGSKERAKQFQEKYVHKLGNLTLTAYNQYLATYSFDKKRERVDANGNYVGYKNGLFLNEKLKTKDTWTIEDISERTGELVEQAFKLFRI